MDEAAPNATEPGLAALEHLAAIITPTAPPPTSTAIASALDRALADLFLAHHLDPATLPPPHLHAAPPTTEPATPSDTADELSPTTITRDDLLLGHAFAALKVLGHCPAHHLHRAIAAIDHQNDPAMLTLRAPDDPSRFIEHRAALRTILECALLSDPTLP